MFMFPAVVRGARCFSHRSAPMTMTMSRRGFNGSSSRASNTNTNTTGSSSNSSSSSANANANAKNGSGSGSSSFLPWYVRRGLRVAQVLVLSLSVFEVGRQRGLMQYAQFPAETAEAMLQACLPLSAASDEDLRRFREIRRTAEYQRVARVLQRVVTAATQVVHDKLQTLDHETQQEEIQTLTTGLRKLQGSWELVLFPSDEVNAFVSGLCPHKVFMFTGLLQKTHPTDDELAVVLAHELSHIVLGHNEEKSNVTVMLLAVQLMVLTLVDPLGFSSMIFDYFAESIKNMLTASHSRDTENEADQLGLEVAASACYDITQGVGVMQKLAMVSQNITVHEHHSHNHPQDMVYPVPKEISTSWYDSHPSSTERFEELQNQARSLVEKFKEEYSTARKVEAAANLTKPNHCYGVLADLQRSGILWWKFW